MFHIQDHSETGETISREIDQGQQLFIHRHSLIKSYRDACVEVVITETEHDIGCGKTMRSLVCSPTGEKSEWAQMIALEYLAAIIAERLRTGWKILSSVGLSIYIIENGE